MRSMVVWILSGLLAALGVVLMLMSSPGEQSDRLNTRTSAVKGATVQTDNTIASAHRSREMLASMVKQRQNALVQKARNPVLDRHAGSDLDFHFDTILDQAARRIDTEFRINARGYNLAGTIGDNPFDGVPNLAKPLDNPKSLKDGWLGSDSGQRQARIALGAIETTLDILKQTMTQRRPETLEIVELNFSRFADDDPAARVFGENDPYKRYTYTLLVRADTMFAQSLIDAFALAESSPIELYLVGWSIAPPIYPHVRFHQLTWDDYARMGQPVPEDKRIGEDYDEWERERKNAKYDEEIEYLRNGGGTVKLPVHLMLKLQVLEARPDHPAFKPREAAPDR